MCSRALRHNVPVNYIVLALFTASMAFMIAGITAYMSFEGVGLAILTLMITLVCLFGAFLFTPNKLAALRGVLIGIVAACVLQLVVCFSMLAAGYITDGLYIFYCILGVLIASGLIYIDLFIVMLAGKYAMDEYIYCALLLYIDIIRLLLYILMLFSKK